MMLKFNAIKQTAKNNNIKISEKATFLIQKHAQSEVLGILKRADEIARKNRRTVVLKRDIELVLSFKARQ